MTFKEKLADISNSIEFELSVAQYCAEIRDAMEAAAHSNYRTFQIEIVRLLGDSSFSKATNRGECGQGSRTDRISPRYLYICIEV